MSKKELSVVDLSRRSGITKGYWYTVIQTGRLAATKNKAGCWMVKEDIFDAYMEARKTRCAAIATP